MARRDLRAWFLGVEMITANTVKGNLPALCIVILPITSVVIEPQNAKYAENQETVNNDLESKMGRRNHTETSQESVANAKGK